MHDSNIGFAFLWRSFFILTRHGIVPGVRFARSALDGFVVVSCVTQLPIRDRIMVGSGPANFFGFWLRDAFARGGTLRNSFLSSELFFVDY